MENKKVYGIDLGTTYSAIAHINEYNQAEIIPNSDNERITPSVVFFESPDNIVVGSIAKESAKTDPDKVVEFVKRQMGADWTFTYQDVNYRPQEISSYILRRLAGDAQKIGGHEVHDVVITCPAYFGDAERDATRLAGQLAGLNVIQILDEPAAAALFYGMNNIGERSVALIYDLGGGTFDVSLVCVDNNEITIICTDGDHRLGGKDWDDAIVNYLVSEFESQFGAEDKILEDQESSYNLRLEAERAKQTLTLREKCTVRVASLTNRANIEITRENFENLTRNLLDRTVDFTRSVIEYARTQKGVDKIDAFLLVGGSTRMPMIARRLSEEFAASLGCEPKAFEVDEAVAKGAALYGHIQTLKVKLDDAAEQVSGDNASFAELSEEDQRSALDIVSAESGLEPDYLLEAASVAITTVATKSYGIRAKKGGVPIVRNLVLRQTPTPTVGEFVFHTETADASFIELRVFSNNIPEADAPLEDSEEIGVTSLEVPSELPAGAPIRVKFTISTEGALQMEATDLTTGANVQANFVADVGMSQEEINDAVERSHDLVVE